MCLQYSIGLSSLFQWEYGSICQTFLINTIKQVGSQCSVVGFPSLRWGFHFWRKLYIFRHCSTKSRYPTLLQKHLEYAGHCWKEKSRIEWRHEKQNFKTRSSSSWKMTEHFESHIFQLHYCTPHTWPNGFWLCCSGSCCWCDWPLCCSASFCWAAWVFRHTKKFGS